MECLRRNGGLLVALACLPALLLAGLVLVAVEAGALLVRWREEPSCSTSGARTARGASA